MIDLVKDCDLYIYQARVSKQPPKAWRSKVRHTGEPEPGHPRIWMLGDSMHAMLPNRGMGGNTAMCDTATALPLLSRLASLSVSGTLTHNDISKACDEYEAEMIPRAFAWVRKSGGSNIVVSLFIHMKVPELTPKPIDAGTFVGRILFKLAAVALSLAYYWYAVSGIFVSHSFVDDAPELR